MYTVKVLSSKEFDEVSKSDARYSYVDDTNMGFADRENGLAYVRGTYLHDLNKYLVNHELEELEADESTHEDFNGIRHKKFFKESVPAFYDPPGLFRGSGPLGGPLTGGASAKEENQVSPEFNVQPQQLSFPQPEFTTTPSGPFSQFSTQGASSSRIPESVTGSFGGSLGGGIGSGIGQQQQLSPEVLERLKGFYAGRIAF